MQPDIRLQTVPFEMDGRTFQLRCNMNVLADVQADFGGDFSSAINSRNSMKSVLSFLAAMLNDYAEEKGWPERYTRQELGRKMDFEAFAALPKEEIFRLVSGAVFKPKTAEELDEPGESPVNEDSTKN